MVFVPLKARPVISLFKPGPLRRKSCAFDLSLTVIVYLPAFKVLTFTPAFLSVIVKPGPVVPLSLVALMSAKAVGGTTSAATASKGRRRRIDSTPLVVDRLSVLRERPSLRMAR